MRLVASGEVTSSAIHRAEALCGKKDYDRAVADYDEAIRLRKQRLEKLRDLNALEVILQNELLMLGRLEDARRNARRLVDGDGTPCEG
jgi:hypothetical protein